MISSFHGKFKTNRDWWPNQLDLSGLRRNSDKSIQWGKLSTMKLPSLVWITTN